MTESHNVQRCRWAEPTLFQKNPLWTAADAYPWSCLADGEPHPVEDTARCASCGRFAPRGPSLASSPTPVDDRCHCGCPADCKGD